MDGTPDKIISENYFQRIENVSDKKDTIRNGANDSQTSAYTAQASMCYKSVFFGMSCQPRKVRPRDFVAECHPA